MPFCVSEAYTFAVYEPTFVMLAPLEYDIGLPSFVMLNFNADGNVNTTDPVVVPPFLILVLNVHASLLLNFSLYNTLETAVSFSMTLIAAFCLEVVTVCDGLVVTVVPPDTVKLK